VSGRGYSIPGNNFNNFRPSFVIFGKNHPDTSLYSDIRKLAQIYNIVTYGEMTSYPTSSKIPFTDKDRHLTKAFQKEKKHDTASQLLKEYANRNWSRR